MFSLIHFLFWFYQLAAASPHKLSTFFPGLQVWSLFSVLVTRFFLRSGRVQVFFERLLKALVDVHSQDFVTETLGWEHVAAHDAVNGLLNCCLLGIFGFEFAGNCSHHL